VTAVLRFPVRRAKEFRGGAPWEACEDQHLARLRRAGLTCGQLAAAVRIVAEDWGRAVPEVCRRFDFLLGAGAVREGRMTVTERALYALAGRAGESAEAPGGFVLDGRMAEWRDVAWREVGSGEPDARDSLFRVLEHELDLAERRAWVSLARNKFQMFGFWAAIWVHLNRVGGLGRPNPFASAVGLARERTKP
jgi:hypothetical protein